MLRRSRHAVHFSSANSEWATPQWVYDALDAEFHFTLDPCATSKNAKCARFFTSKDDGLAQDWSRQVVFMNPPYGRAIGSWMRKAHESARRGATVVCLVPARTDTRWWHEHAMRGRIHFLRGRLKFGNARHGAPLPSAIVIFGNPPTAKKKNSRASGCSCRCHHHALSRFHDNTSAYAHRLMPDHTAGADRH